ncbi:MAG TPA: helix-turn-helix domain-containing protein [Candidatus Dormibacteraeota bacterium]|nr:helix-turn-helix domain-containing protein [Candidatus Dormibacteraeota bacterium]
MAVELGLRQRKKQQTRQAIYEAARRLFAERGFDRVAVAEVAREANVSEVTVFNYFPTKEDLFYAGMHFFEEELLDAVRRRKPGESALRAFRRKLLDSVEGLRSKERFVAIRKATETFAASPSLAARERQIVDRYTRSLAELLAGASEPDVESVTVATALMGAHRAVVEHVRRRVQAGARGDALADDARAQIRRAFGRLERGLEN